MSLIPIYSYKSLIGKVTQEKFVPVWIFSGALAFMDMVLIVCSFVISDFTMLILDMHGDGAATGTLWFGLIVSMATVGVLFLIGHYSKTVRSSPYSFLDFPKSLIIATAITGCVLLFSWPAYAVSSDALLFAVAVGLFAAWPLRSLVIDAVRAWIVSGKLVTSRAIVFYKRQQVSERDAGADVLKALRDEGVDVVHYQLIASEKDSGATDGLVGLRDTCARVIRERQPHIVYVALDARQQLELRWLREALGPLTVPVCVLSRSPSRESTAASTTFSASRLLQLQRSPLNVVHRVQKRVFDILVSLTLIFLLAPLLVMVACAIKLESPGPAIFRQTRCGLGGKKFKILKFRTMSVLEDGSHIRQAERQDVRVTPLGRILRQTSIDELPQLLNVLLGQMSLVGPRPHAIAHDEFYGGLIPSYAFRHMVKPGLTGWAQVSGYRGPTPRVEDMAARVEHDTWYIHNWTFWLDIKILLRTAFIVFRDNNAY
jgi:Undecaprenyl-phosphate glucose phosphotransferase